MFITIYRFMDKLWQKIEIILIIAILTTMALVTFIYTMMNNLYSFFYWLAEKTSFLEGFFFSIGDLLLDVTFTLAWSNSLTKASFAWLIFFCMSYGVRVGGHIGVDALIKLLSQQGQRIVAYVGLGACLLYAGIYLIASIEWVHVFFSMKTDAEDLNQLGILKWHIAIIVPIGFILMIIRYLEIGYRLYKHQQNSLGLADEAGDAMQDVLRQSKENSV